MAGAKSVRTRKHQRLEKSVESRIYIILIIIAVVVALFYVRIKVEAIRLGYELNRNKKVNIEYEKEKQMLRSELNGLKSPDNMEKLAVEYGFKFPTQEDIIYVEQRKITKNQR